MKPAESTTKDGYLLGAGMFVQIAPEACGKRHHLTARVIQPGPTRSQVQPASHRHSQWVENKFLSAQKSKNQQRGVAMTKYEPTEDDVKVPQLKIANTVADDDKPAGAHAGGPPATADDFDALANMIDRLRESAHAKLMRLAEDQRTAKTMLAEAEAKIAHHLNQCRALGIDLGQTREAAAV